MKHHTKIVWKKNTSENFTSGKYSRVHKWYFDEGTEIRASSSPKVIPVPMSDPSAVDPEEALLAALSSCHMLFFLSIVSSKKYTIESYEDTVEGIMQKNDNGKISMSEITLNPKTKFSSTNIPSVKEITDMHQLAHSQCYIANSLNSKINIFPN
ncbi:organic hydroperoxide reductase OsmC/OhrA [Tenacibaculum adriaticum]|uniref:Organic hydroperoxide reductase OsmC/OhrA n=1 Tax=Tenacibaculum adriaticum TaxID=413713 RepID=A0A5S5DXU4_9FLAO|nr:OsmC family protein [Tenacibaculum adriaticum]TYP99429.1 organic hydroperoxide reductase OsmC/OhrA [Tenacibaculum adriaticum]